MSSSNRPQNEQSNAKAGIGPDARPAPKPRVLHNDAHLMVLDKPPGWPTHAAEGARSVLAWLQQRERDQGGDPTSIRLVHRLDRDTTGVLLVARGAEVAATLTNAFRDHRVYKTYLALTWPVPSVRWARIEIRQAPRRIAGGERMVVVETGGQEAITEIEVLARGRRYGLVRAVPEHGRKHQVRVACQELSTPILGDFIYGGRRVSKLAPRIMLHARSIELAHPVTGEHVVFRAPVPADMRAILEDDGSRIPSELDRRERSPTKKRR